MSEDETPTTEDVRREGVARAIRTAVKIGPMGPNALGLVTTGGTTWMTPREASEAADAAIAYLAAHDAEVTEALRAEVARLDDFTTVVALSRDRDEWKARAKASEAKIAAVEAVCAGIEVLPVPHSPMMSQTDITKRIIGTIIRAVRAALTDEPRP